MRFHCGISFKFKDLKKYFKWLLLILGGLYAFSNVYNVHAEVIDNYSPGGNYNIFVNNQTIKYRWITVQSGDNTDIRLDYLTPGNPLGCIPTDEGGSGCYVRYTLCVDSDLDSASALSSNVASIVFNKTTNSCSYYDSSYTGGRIAYLDYWVDPVETGDEQASVRYSNTIRLKFRSAVSIQANQVEIQEGKFEISLGEVVSDIKDSINNQTTTIINNNNNNTQQIIDSNEEIKDTLTDETPPTIDDNTFGDIDIGTSGAVSGLITMPITLLNKLTNSLNDSCTPYTIPFGLTGGSETLTFPCINLEEYLGSTIWNYMDLFICLFMGYEIAMLIISSFESITSLEDGFASLYSPRHAKPIGKHTSEVE